MTAGARGAMDRRCVEAKPNYSVCQLCTFLLWAVVRDFSPFAAKVNKTGILEQQLSTVSCKFKIEINTTFKQNYPVNYSNISEIYLF